MNALIFYFTTWPCAAWWHAKDKSRNCISPYPFPLIAPCLVSEHFSLWQALWSSPVPSPSPETRQSLVPRGSLIACDSTSSTDGHVVFPELRPFCTTYRYTITLQTMGYLPMLPEGMLSALFDLSNPFHHLDSRSHQFPIVANRNISSFLEIDSRILEDVIKRWMQWGSDFTHNGHFLASCFSESLRPPHFSWISLHSNMCYWESPRKHSWNYTLEVFMTSVTQI